ncbi:MAG: HAMP domain-containing protein [Firmicutes bacterium]|nr:HAMP domain-containing protein [Bacillota bacterium]
MRRHLLAQLAILVASFLLLGGLVLGQVDAVVGSLRTDLDRWLQAVEAAAHTRSALGDLRLAELEMVTAPDAGARRQAEQEAASAADEASRYLALYRRSLPDPSALDAFQRDFQSYLDYHARLVQAVESGSTARAESLFRQGAGPVARLEETIHSLRHMDYRDAVASESIAGGLRDRLLALMVAAGAAVVGIDLVLGLNLLGSFLARLRGLRRAAADVGEGRFDVQLGPPVRDELGEVEEAFRTMSATLAEKEAENRRLREARERAERERIELLSRQFDAVVEAQEQERQRIARELHDEAGQRLTSLQYGLEFLRRALADPALAERAGGLGELARQTMAALHDLAVDLRPPLLDDAGLEAALREYAHDFAQRYQVPTEVETRGLEGLPPSVQLLLFRVVQEALTNVARHAHARRARVEVVREGERLYGRVEDDGVGFETGGEAARQGRRCLGLAGMRERVRMLGGQLAVRSAPGRGTVVEWEGRLGAGLAAGLEAASPGEERRARG